MSKILVTGSSGYIGSVLVGKLIEKGHKVSQFDTNYFNPGFIGQGDIRKIDVDFIKDQDVIIHLAGLSNDPMGEINPDLTHEINFEATLRMAKMAKSWGVKRFIFSSSCSVYGDSNESVVNEESKTHPLTAYAQSKLDCEQVLLQMCDKDFQVVILRNSTVFGYAPMFRNDLVVNRMSYFAVKRGFLDVFGGEQWRPLIDVRDLSDVFVSSIDKNVGIGTVVNVGYTNYQIKEIPDYIKQFMPEVKINLHQDSSDQRSYKVDFSKFKQLFPELQAQWGMGRSVQNLLKEIKYLHDGGVFERLEVLKMLMDMKKLDKELRWIR